MSEIDYGLLKSMISVEDVLRNYGIKIISKGKTKTFLCPAHSDKKTGNCYIRGKKSWECYSCGAGGTILDLTKTILGLDTIDEAAICLAEEFGLTKDVTPQDENKAKIPYGLIKELGIKNRRNILIPVGFSYNEDNKDYTYEKREDNFYEKYLNIKVNPIVELFNDKEAFKWFIREKVHEKWHISKMLLLKSNISDLIKYYSLLGYNKEVSKQKAMEEFSLAKANEKLWRSKWQELKTN